MLVSLVACVNDDGFTDATTTTTTSTTVGSTVSNSTSMPYTEWDAEGYHVYVDSTGGKDSNDGLTEATAVESLARANEIALDYINSPSASKEDVIISMASGDYVFNETFVPISGTDDVHVYYNARGGRAKIAGGQRIVSDYISKCVDEEILGDVKDETARNNLYEIDLTAYAAALTPLYTHYEQGTSFDGVSFFANNDLIEFARWPNLGEAVPDNDNSPLGIDSLTGYFHTPYICFVNEKGVIVTPTEETASGNTRTSPMVVYLTSGVVDRISTWDFSRDIYTHDYFSNNWDDSIHKVTDFNEGSFTAINGVTYDGYIVTDRGRTYNSEMAGADGNGSSMYRRGTFINVVEEIDVLRECYYDYEEMKLYVYLTEQQVAEGIYISTSQLLMSIEGAKNLTFRNIDFQYSQGALVTVANVDNLSFIGVSISNASGDGMSVDYATDFTLRDSKIYNTGTQALSITNCNGYSTESANILVENNHIFNMGWRRNCYEVALNIKSVSGAIIRNNTMNGGKHAAIQPSWLYDCVFEYNEIYDFITESDDVGLIYSHGEKDAQFGVVFRYNYIHDIGAKWQTWKIAIFYNDAMGLGYSTYGNIIANIGAGGKAPVAFTTSPRAAEYHDNLIFNTSENFELGCEDPYAQYGNWWRSVAGLSYPNDVNDVDYRSPLLLAGIISQSQNVPGKYDMCDWADDETRNFSYEYIRYLASQDAIHEVYSSGIALMQGVEHWQNDNGMSVINDDTVELFEIEVFSAANGVSAGTHTFDTSDELFDTLYALGYRGEVTLNDPNYRIIYDDNYIVSKLYYNIYEKDGQGGYRFSEIAKAYAANLGVAESDITISTFNRNVDDTVSMVARYYFWSPVGYAGVLSRNVFINAQVEGGEFEYSPIIKMEQNLIIDGIDEDTLFDEDGYYTVSIDDIIYNLEYEIDLPDLSEIGAKIG